MNAIAGYFFSEVVAIALNGIRVGGNSVLTHIFNSVFAPLASPANASLLYALAYVALCWMVMELLYRKGVFLKI
jgi:predicted acyltransferase